jgi:hypothetical protein
MSTKRPYYNKAPQVSPGTLGEYVTEFGRYPARVKKCSEDGLYLTLQLKHDYETTVWHSYFEPVTDEVKQD